MHMLLAGRRDVILYDMLLDHGEPILHKTTSSVV
jgi:hypothetical protein